MPFEPHVDCTVVAQYPFEADPAGAFTHDAPLAAAIWQPPQT